MFLFNDTLKMFCLWLYGVKHILLPLFLISSKGSFISIISQKREHNSWNEKQLSVSTMSNRSDDPSHNKWMLYHGDASSSNRKMSAHGAMGYQIHPHGGPIELFLVLASAP